MTPAILYTHTHVQYLHLLSCYAKVASSLQHQIYSGIQFTLYCVRKHTEILRGSLLSCTTYHTEISRTLSRISDMGGRSDIHTHNNTHSLSVGCLFSFYSSDNNNYQTLNSKLKHFDKNNSC